MYIFAVASLPLIIFALGFASGLAVVLVVDYFKER